MRKIYPAFSRLFVTLALSSSAMYAAPVLAQTLPAECSGIPDTPGGDPIAARFDRNATCYRLMSQLSDIVHKESDIERARQEIRKSREPEHAPTLAREAPQGTSMIPGAMMPSGMTPPPMMPPMNQTGPASSTTEKKPEPAPILPQVEAIGGRSGSNHAYLRLPDGSSTVVVAGAKLAGGLVVRKVLADSVIVSSPSGETTLPMATEDDQSAETSSTFPNGSPPSHWSNMR